MKLKKKDSDLEIRLEALRDLEQMSPAVTMDLLCVEPAPEIKDDRYGYRFNISRGLVATRNYDQFKDVIVREWGSQGLYLFVRVLKDRFGVQGAKDSPETWFEAFKKEVLEDQYEEWT